MKRMNLTERDKRELATELNEWNLRACMAICESERNRESKWWGGVYWAIQELLRVESPNEDIEKIRGEFLPGDTGNTRKQRYKKWSKAQRAAYERKWGANAKPA